MKISSDFKFWIIPIACLVLISFVIGFVYDHKVKVVYPNSIIELDELQSMSCDEITARNSLGSYWTRENGKFAREKVNNCLDAQIAYKENLKEILKLGTHDEKINAGFKLLWFGMYNHTGLPFLPTTGNIDIIHGTEHGISSFVPEDTMVIIGYNNTITFTNETDMAFLIQENDGLFITKLINPGQSDRITIVTPGEYEYFAKPQMTGVIKVISTNQNT